MSSTPKNDAPPQIPRWFLWLAAVVALNAGLVSWSVIQRLALADSMVQSSNVQESAELNSDGAISSSAVESSTATPLSDQEKLKLLVAPALSTDKPAGEVPTDDPLMNVIRKQVATQFPEVFDADSESESRAQRGTISDAVLQANSEHRENALQAAPILAGRTQADSTVVTLQLEAVGSLTDAALLLTELAIEQRELGQHDQAEASLARVQELRRIMIELLK